MWHMEAETVADIDVKIVSARWRYLHHDWEGERKAAEKDRREIDELLERRYALSRGADESSAATGASGLA